MAFQDQLRVAFSSAFLRQTSQGTALANGDLDKTFRATLVRYERDFRIKGIRDCSNLYLARQEPLARLYRITLEFDLTPHLFGGFLAGAMGVPAAPTGTTTKTHTINMLPPSIHDLFLHTFIIGHDDASGEAWKYKDCAINSVTATASAGVDTVWRCTVDMVASGNRASVTGYTFPACIDETPAKLYDGTFIINSTDYINLTKALACSYSNNIMTGDDPFVGGSLDIKRLRWSRDGRIYQMGGSIIGTDRPGDTLVAAAYANSDIGTTYSDFSMRIGTADEGVTIEVPSGILKADAPGQSYAGEANEAVINVMVAALKVAGDATSPMNATVVLPSALQSTAFEVAA